MATATVHPNNSLISSARTSKAPTVYGPGADKVGEIDHLMIDKVSGNVTYAVMSFGGFLGLGHSHYPVPWAALKYDTSSSGYRTNVTEAQLKDAPQFSDDSWADRNWETRRSRALQSAAVLGPVVPADGAVHAPPAGHRCPAGGVAMS